MNRAFALLVALTGFMELFDGTVIQTALPRIGADLGVDAATASVAMAGYFGAVAATIPVCGWLALRFGVRRTFTIGIVVFAVASLAAGMATTLGALLALRLLQGVGGAMMLTIGQLAILRNAPKEMLLNVTAYLVWPALAAPVIAPVVGGIVTDSIGWRWLFFINVPIGILGAAMALRLAPVRLASEAKPKLDGIGAVLLALGLGLTIPTIELSSEHLSLLGGLAIGLGLLLCAAAVVWMLRTANPLLDLRAFSIPTFRVGNGVGALYRLVVGTVPVMLTLLFQLHFGWSAAIAGAAVMFLFAGNLGAKPFANYSVRRWGFRAVIVGATLVGSATVGLAAALMPDTPFWAIGLLLFVSGSARSIGFTAYMSMQYADVPKERMDSAGPLSNTTQQLSSALGIALFVGLLTWLLGAVSASVAFGVVFTAMAAGLLATTAGVLGLGRGAAAHLMAQK